MGCLSPSKFSVYKKLNVNLQRRSRHPENRNKSEDLLMDDFSYLNQIKKKIERVQYLSKWPRLFWSKCSHYGLYLKRLKRRLNWAAITTVHNGMVWECKVKYIHEKLHFLIKFTRFSLSVAQPRLQKVQTQTKKLLLVYSLTKGWFTGMKWVGQLSCISRMVNMHVSKSCGSSPY